MPPLPFFAVGIVAPPNVDVIISGLHVNCCHEFEGLPGGEAVRAWVFPAGNDSLMVHMCGPRCSVSRVPHKVCVSPVMRHLPMHRRLVGLLYLG